MPATESISKSNMFKSIGGQLLRMIPVSPKSSSLLCQPSEPLLFVEPICSKCKFIQAYLQATPD